MTQNRLMNEVEVENLLTTGETGAQTFTQVIGTELVSWWTPTIGEIPIANGGILKFSTYEEAEAEAVDLQRRAIARYGHVRKETEGDEDARVRTERSSR